MVDLRTRYLGFDLVSPIVASAGPLTGDPRALEALESAGVGAVVLPSLFEEQIDQEAFAFDAIRDQGTNVFVEAQSYLPELDDDDTGPSRHLALVERARERLTVPVIASLNGVTPGGWVRYARYLVDAGAHAIELNLYDVVTDPHVDAAAVEHRYAELVEEVRAEVAVPLAVKLSPWFTSLANVAHRFDRIGVDGLVLFNRLYQPDIDLGTLQVAPRLQLSSPAELRLPLHWIGLLAGRVGCSLAASTGVHSGADALKVLLAGADVAMTTSAVLRHGAHHVATMLAEIRDWMTEREYSGVDQLRGSVSQRNVADPQVYERSNYYQVIHSWHR
jgi:dihydroorotate dehydrogenase (fumarate)